MNSRWLSDYIRKGSTPIKSLQITSTQLNIMFYRYLCRVLVDLVASAIVRTETYLVPETFLKKSIEPNSVQSTSLFGNESRVIAKTKRTIKMYTDICFLKVEIRMNARWQGRAKHYKLKIHPYMWGYALYILCYHVDAHLRRNGTIAKFQNSHVCITTADLWRWGCSEYLAPSPHVCLPLPALVPRDTDSWPEQTSNMVSTYQRQNCIIHMILLLHY